MTNQRRFTASFLLWALTALATLTACGGGGGGGAVTGSSVVPVPAPAQTAKAWGMATRVDTNNNIGDVSEPVIVLDADGNALAVWQQFLAGVYNIWANRYTASTGLWGTPTLIETNTVDARKPQIAMDASGNALAVWSQVDGANRNVLANRYTASTGLWGTPTLIETNSAGDASEPQIAFDASGNALAVWQQPDGTHFNIWANRYTASTGLWGTAALIEANTGDAQLPQVAIDASGNALAVWRLFDGTVNNIWANRYTASTGLWGTATLIETSSGNANLPRIAVDASGNALAVWYQFDGMRDNIWANRYTASTGLWGTATLIETNNAGVANNPQIAIDSSGNALAVWDQFDGTRNNIWANRYSATTGWGTATLIETDNAGDALDPQIAFDTSGNALAVWQQSDGTRDNIWANRYTAGTGWGTAALIETSPGNAYRQRIALNASGNAIAVWQQSDGTRDTIVTNRYQ